MASKIFAEKTFVHVEDYSGPARLTVAVKLNTGTVIDVEVSVLVVPTMLDRGTVHERACAVGAILNQIKQPLIEEGRQ